MLVAVLRYFDQFLRAGAVVVLLAGCLVSLTGCQWKGGLTTSRPTRDLDQVWTPQPVQMRVFPSSRFVQRPDHAAILEARIETLDELGDSIKAVGRFRLELLRADGEAGLGDRLYVWDVDMLSLADQQRHYDSVTRTYLLRLQLDAADPPTDATVLRVIFTPLVGQRVETQQVMR